jgi:ABC-type transporter Mla subunit MlaD
VTSVRTAWGRLRESLADSATAQLQTQLQSMLAAEVRSLDQRLEIIDDKLHAIEARLEALAEQARDLRDIAGTQVDIENQTSELFGRLLRSATTRIEELEERSARDR